MATNIKDTTIAATYKFLLKRDSGAYSQTGMNVELQNDSGAALATGLYLESGATTDNVGIGVADPDATLEILDTTTQLKLSYDADDAVTFTVGSDGRLVVDSVSSGSIIGSGFRCANGGTSYIVGSDATNTVWGLQAGQNWAASTHLRNSFYGNLAGNQMTGSASSDNSGFGNHALKACGQGGVATGNTAVGSYAGAIIASGDNNTAMRYRAMLTGSAAVETNTAIGKDCLYNAGSSGGNTDCWANTAVGEFCLYSGGTAFTGIGNTAIGYYAGSGFATVSIVLATGSYNTLIGYEVNTSATDSDNQIVLGNNTNGSEDLSLTFGNGTSDTTCVYGTTSWTNPSDERIKKNVETSTAGLSFIDDLRPVIFDYKTKGELESDHGDYIENSTESYQSDKKQHGFIAQEVKEVLDNHSEIKDGFNGWSVNSVNDYQRIGETAFIPMLITAIQELSAKVEALENA